MLASNYIGVVLAVVVGSSCIRWRHRMAVYAVERHRRVFGARYDPRSFEFCFAGAGVFFLLWAAFVVVGAWLWGGK